MPWGRSMLQRRHAVPLSTNNRPITVKRPITIRDMMPKLDRPLRFGNMRIAPLLIPMAPLNTDYPNDDNDSRWQAGFPRLQLESISLPPPANTLVDTDTKNTTRYPSLLYFFRKTTPVNDFH